MCTENHVYVHVHHIGMVPMVPFGTMSTRVPWYTCTRTSTMVRTIMVPLWYYMCTVPLVMLCHNFLIGKGQRVSTESTTNGIMLCSYYQWYVL
jgi:hypothetical protein